MDPSVKVAVIGCGNWGKNLARNFYSLEFLACICDLDAEILAKIKKQYPKVQTTSRVEDIFENPAINAVVISTPTHTHYRLAKAALQAGKHVYVEKPLATCALETQELYTLSEHMGKVLMVGHLLLYHPVVNRLKQLIEEGVLGEIRYIESDRLNLNIHRADKTVYWDLAPHDLSMMMYLMGQDPVRVVSVQESRTSDDGLVDIAHIELEFPNGVRGHIHNSWVHPVKQVKLVVRGSKRTAVMDDTLPGVEKLQIFSNTLPAEKMIPEYLTLEPLKVECQHFVNAILSGRRPKSDGVNGLRVVQILEEAERMSRQSTIARPHKIVY